jgi:hypothetical protein
MKIGAGDCHTDCIKCFFSRLCSMKGASMIMENP